MGGVLLIGLVFRVTALFFFFVYIYYSFSEILRYEAGNLVVGDEELADLFECQ